MVPERTCVGCRRVTSAEELVRVVRSFDGLLEVGRALPGRGAWLCRGSRPCLDAAARRRAFDRALRAPLAPGAVDRLARQLGLAPPGGQASAGVCEDGVPDGSPPAGSPTASKTPERS